MAHEFGTCTHVRITKATAPMREIGLTVGSIHKIDGREPQDYEGSMPISVFLPRGLGGYWLNSDNVAPHEAPAQDDPGLAWAKRMLIEGYSVNDEYNDGHRAALEALLDQAYGLKMATETRFVPV